MRFLDSFVTRQPSARMPRFGIFGPFLLFLGQSLPSLASTLPESSRPEGLVDLGYAKHVPTSVNKTDS